MGKQSQRHYRTEEPTELRRQMLERDQEVDAELARIDAKSFTPTKVPIGARSWLPGILYIATATTGETVMVLPNITPDVAGKEFLVVKPNAAGTLKLDPSTAQTLDGGTAGVPASFAAVGLYRYVCDGVSGYWRV